MQIRTALVEEYETVGGLTHDAYLPLFDAPHLGWYGRDLRDVAGRAERSDIIVAEIGGVLVGALAYMDDYSTETGHLGVDLENTSGFRVLAVNPSVQGRGIGEALTRWCIERARNDGRAAIVLHTTDFMPAAQRLYRRLGFDRFTEIDYDAKGQGGAVAVMGFRITFGRHDEKGA